MKIEPIPTQVKKLISKLNYAIVEHDCNPNPDNRKVMNNLVAEIKMRQQYTGQRYI
mgnify:CR=1 FL=1